MKNYILVLVALLMACATRSQQINKELLYGKWNLYSAKKQGVIMCLDSIEEGKAAMYKLYLQENPGGVLTATDSAKLGEMLPSILRQLSQSYLIFEKGGKAKAYFSMEERDDDEPDIDRNYIWKSATEIDLLKDGRVYTSLKILFLNADKLVLIKNGEGMDNIIIFKKA